MKETVTAGSSRSSTVSVTNVKPVPKRGEVEDRADRRSSDQIVAPQSSVGARDGEQQQAAAEHRPAVHHQRVELRAALLDRDVADRAAERREHDRQRGQRGVLARAEVEALLNASDQPAERDRRRPASSRGRSGSSGRNDAASSAT